MHKLILIILALFLISCSSKDTTDLAEGQNLYKDNILKDLELFENANNFISKNDLDLALSEIDKIEVLFPSSIYSHKGMLLTAYIYFLKEEYEK